MPQLIGKFEIKRLLGRGAQSSVYLAFDPQLQRPVAIKLLAAAGSGSGSGRIRTLLDEARTVSKLRHESIVPVFEAGEHDRQPYLVFEYVEGRTLDQLIRQDGAIPPPRAAEIMLGILDAIGHAHQAGIVHRDLKPSNILIDPQGRPRVMDFGIASRISAGGGAEQELDGTPAYLAPEYITRRIVGPQGDVFAAGLVLFEMLFGRRAIPADNAFQALHRIANEPIVFPADAAERIDATLHDIIAKATAREPPLRFQSAEQMRQALQAYLRPAAGDGAANGKRENQSTLDFLLRRMRHKSDFPAMSAAISAINRLATSDKGDVTSLSNYILKDFALTNKILRLANSAYYPQTGGGRISTVSRAIVTLGFDAVRNLAISLLLFEHLRDKKHAELLREEFLHINLSGLLAKELAGRSSHLRTEEAFICALFHHLGRLLTYYYFLEEAETIRKLATQDKISEESAAVRVLGIGYQDLGIGVARSWGFPESIIHSMRHPPEGRLARPGSPEDHLRLVSALSNGLCAIIETHAPQEAGQEMSRLVSRFEDALQISTRDAEQAVASSLQELSELSGILGIALGKSRFGAHVAAATAPPPAAAGGTTAAPAPADVVSAAATGTSAGPSDQAAASDAQTILAAGIQDVSQALVDELSITDLLRIVTETMYRALGARRVLMCMRDGRTGTMSARFGFGADVDTVARHFRFELGGTADIFNLILAKDVDLLVSDAAAPKIVNLLPEWYRRHFSGQSFMLFPLRVRNSPVGMIYADNDTAGSIAVSEKELALLRTLRNQAVLAIKQAL